MRNRYTAVIQRDGKWYIAFCPEVPEANGQGKTRQECLEKVALGGRGSTEGDYAVRVEKTSLERVP